MKKILATVSGALSSSLFFANSALAALPAPPTVNGLATDVGTSGISNAIVRVIEFILNIILVIAVVYVVVAGIRLIVSGGDEGEKDKAKTTIIYVAAGILVILLARVIVTFVGNIL